MANILKMEKKETVLALLRLGWSYRRIERETGVRRETISRYDPDRDSKAARVAPGSGEQKRPKRPPAQSSLCEPYRCEIEKKLRQGLQAKRIWQDLVFACGFDGAYNSVKRFCRKLKADRPRVFARVETPAGRDLQIDFGKGALTRTESGRYRRPHLSKAVLCYSRHSYEEVIRRESSPRSHSVRHCRRRFSPALRSSTPTSAKHAAVQRQPHPAQPSHVLSI